MKEVDEIKARYQRRQQENKSAAMNKYFLFNKYMQQERERIYKKIIASCFLQSGEQKVLEIGAGEGGNIPFFHSIGIPFSNIYANELLEERLIVLKEKFPAIHILPGDALAIQATQVFDIVFQSTVFTSVLDYNFKSALAEKMVSVLKPGGLILWYDFIYNNPLNKDVKGVSKNEIRKLFPKSTKINFYSVTVAPPVGRRIGKLYNIFNYLFPFLRTHVVAAINIEHV